MKYLITLLLLQIGAVNVSYSGKHRKFYYTLNGNKMVCRRTLISYYHLAKSFNISPSLFWIQHIGKGQLCKFKTNKIR